MVSAIIDRLQISHLLDFGCGDLSLANSLTPQREFKYQAYDPDIEQYSDKPVPAELVTAINVLEASEADKTLDDLEELVEYVLFVVIDVEKQPMEWWLPKIWDRFAIQTVQVIDKDQFLVIANNINIPF